MVDQVAKKFFVMFLQMFEFLQFLRIKLLSHPLDAVKIFLGKAKSKSSTL